MISTIIESDKPADLPRKWFTYYYDLLPNLHAEYLVAATDYGMLPGLADLNSFDSEGFPEAGGFNVMTHATRVQKPHRQWRSLLSLVRLAKRMQLSRFFFFDSDLWILRPRFARMLDNVHSGIASPWCKRHGFPETSIMVICADRYDELISFLSSQDTEFTGMSAEQVMPVTTILEAIGDRYGEGNLPVPVDADYCTHSPGFEPEFL